MTHNPKVYPAGLADGVSNVDAYELERLDLGQFASVNGDDGGTWDPALPIVIGYSGVQFVLSAGIYLPFAEGARTFVRNINPTPVCRLINGATAGFFQVFGNAGSSGFTQTLPIPNGATLTNVRTYVFIDGSHTSLPKFGPSLSLYSIPVTSVPPTGVLSLNSTGAKHLQLPSTFTAYNALGLTYWDYPCDQNSVMDNSTRGFFALVQDEDQGGAIAGNAYFGFQLTYTMTSYQPQ